MRRLNLGRSFDAQIYKNECLRIVLLEPRDAYNATRLHHHVTTAFATDEKNFLTDRSVGEFKTLLAEGHLVVGIVRNKKLVAQTILLLPTAKNPDTGMHGFDHNHAPETVAVICGQVVHPQYRHHGLQTLMTSVCLEIAEKAGRPNVLSDICTDNAASWKSQMRAGMTICGLSADPAVSDSAVYFMYGNASRIKKGDLSAQFNAAAVRTVPVDDLEQQKVLLTSGYHGVSYDRDKNLIFKPV